MEVVLFYFIFGQLFSVHVIIDIMFTNFEVHNLLYRSIKLHLQYENTRTRL